MCSFTVLGGSGGGSENQSVSGVTTICLTQCNTSPFSRVDQVIDCGLWNVGPLLFNGCVKLLDIGWNWNTSYIRRSRASQTCSMGDMSGEYAGHARTGMISASRNCVQMLATWGRALSCCKIRWWSWMNGTTMGLTISPRYLCAFKMSSMSITYACTYHNPTVTMGHLIHNVDIRKPLTHTTPYTLSAICPVQWKPGFIREENTSPKGQIPSNVSICPLESVMTTNCSQVETPMRMTSFPETVYDSLCRNYFGYANRLLQQLSGWLVSDDLGGEDAGCGGPELVWLHVVCGCEVGWMYCQILWSAFGDGLW